MPQQDPDKSLTNPANWTVSITTQAFSLLLAIFSVLYVLAENRSDISVSLVAASVAGFIVAMVLLVAGSRPRNMPEVVIGSSCVLMLIFIALFNMVANGPNSFVLLQLLIPVCYAALHASRLGVIIVTAICGLVLLLLNMSQWLTELTELVVLCVSFLPLVFVAALVYLLNTDGARNRSSLAEMAEQDQLTGLLNLDSFSHILALEHKFAATRSISYALLVIDIDDLRIVNDQYGREAGDQVLKAIGDALTRSVRQEDKVARFGEDEFVVYLAYSSEKTAEEVANRIRQNIYNMTLSFERRAKRIEASVGIAVFPESGDSVKNLLSFARQAMQRDKAFKKSQRGTVVDPRQQAGLEQSK